MTTSTPAGAPAASNMPLLDEIDRRLIAELDRDVRAPVVLLAERTGYARGTVQSRLERLAASQVLRPHSTRVQMAALGLPLRGIVMAQVDQDEFVPAIEALRQIPEVIECVGISGRDDLMCQVGARD
ncbi:MAG TPA: AsnC family transcriptional regulator, partial [Cellulomonas sp.]